MIELCGLAPEAECAGQVFYSTLALEMAQSELELGLRISLIRQCAQLVGGHCEIALAGYVRIGHLYLIRRRWLAVVLFLTGDAAFLALQAQTQAPAWSRSPVRLAM